MAITGRGVLAADMVGSGIEVTPPTQNINISQTENRDVLVEFTNRNNLPIDVDFSFVDFDALGNFSGTAFLNGQLKLSESHKLSQWVTISPKAANIQPKDKVAVKVHVSNTQSLSAGGHYGAILATIKAPGDKKTTSTILLNESVSSLIFLTKSGGEVYSLSLKNNKFSYSLFGLPTKTDLLFTNNGNTHLIPRGLIEITDWRGALVKKGIINAESNILLPENERTYTAQLANVTKVLLPGKYTVKIQFRYSADSAYSEVTKSILYLPVLPTILAIAIVILVWFLLRKMTLKVILRKKQRHQST